MGYVRCDDRAGRDAKIRELHRTGLSLREVGSIVGCSHSTVREALDPELKARLNAERAARNTSPAGLQRQRAYRAGELDASAPRIVERLRATDYCRTCGEIGAGETTIEHRGWDGDHLRYHFCDGCLATLRGAA